jgi:hypothetical protein
LTETGDGNMDKSGICFPERFKAQTDCFKMTGLKGFHEHISVLHEPEESFSAGTLIEIKGDTEFIGVVIGEEETIFDLRSIGSERTYFSRSIAFRSFDLHDRSA